MSKQKDIETTQDTV